MRPKGPSHGARHSLAATSTFRGNRLGGVQSPHLKSSYIATTPTLGGLKSCSPAGRRRPAPGETKPSPLADCGWLGCLDPAQRGSGPWGRCPKPPLPGDDTVPALHNTSFHKITALTARTHKWMSHRRCCRGVETPTPPTAWSLVGWGACGLLANGYWTSIARSTSGSIGLSKYRCHSNGITHCSTMAE